MAGKQRAMNGLSGVACEYKDPLYDEKELRSIAPADHKQSFDIRSVIARIVDGSEFDEFKKLYGSVRTFKPLKSSSVLSTAINVDLLEGMKILTCLCRL